MSVLWSILVTCLVILRTDTKNHRLNHKLYHLLYNQGLIPLTPNVDIIVFLSFSSHICCLTSVTTTILNLSIFDLKTKSCFETSFYFVSNWGFSINVICDLWFFICVLKVFKHIKNRGNSKMDGYMPITHIQHLSRSSNSFMSYLIWISLILLVEGLERPFKYDSDKITKKSQLISEYVIQGFKYTIFPCPGPCSVK